VVSALAALAGALLALAGLALVVGLRPAPPAPPRVSRRRARQRPPVWRSLLLRAAAGLAAGVAVAVATGWLAAVAVGPLAAVGAGWLLAAPTGGASIDRLEAIEEWTRLLAGKLRRGDMLGAALRDTAHTAPAPIRAEVAALAADLRSTRSVEVALRRFAERLDDPTGDLVVANLVLASRRDGSGLAAVLEGLAGSVAHDVAIRREVQADRAQPRREARTLTVVTLVMIAGLTLATGHTAPYAVWPGPVVLAGLLGGYLGALVWMRRVSAPVPVPRFLDLRAWQARQPTTTRVGVSGS
jgi:Flp pilus assembly protein TadB